MMIHFDKGGIFYGSLVIRVEDISIYLFNSRLLAYKAIMPTVKQTISTDDEFAVEVESTVTGTKCHKCGQFIDKPFNKGREIKIHRSSAFGKPVYIRIAPPRCQ